MTTALHPACNSVSAIARPNPDVEPVTSAIFPSYPKKDDRKELLSGDVDGVEEDGRDDVEGDNVGIAVDVAAIADVLWNRCCGGTTRSMFWMLMFFLLTLCRTKAVVVVAVVLVL